jgi:hypothetical protein
MRDFCSVKEELGAGGMREVVEKGRSREERGGRKGERGWRQKVLGGTVREKGGNGKEGWSKVGRRGREGGWRAG